tara:strand:- start:220 stop:663 length:444 start_codon:yes stop_codon:yes gene_type:complete
MVSALEMELEILNYKNFQNYSSDTAHNRMIQYFRSSLHKRIIGCHLVCQTLQEKWTLQSEIHTIYNINRSMISMIIKEGIEEGWFVSKICEDHQNQLCYQASNYMIKKNKEYNIWKFQKGNNKKMVRFVKNYHNEILDGLLCSKKSM